MRLSSADADDAPRIASRTARAAPKAFPSRGGHVDALDRVPEIAGGVPQGLRALGFADPVERADHEAMGAGAGRRPRRRPLAERVTAQVGPELGAPPRRASVDGELHLGDA